MMNKYSGFSNFKINKLVAEELGYKYSSDSFDGAVVVEGISSGHGGFKKIILQKNYCFDYQDSFKLMIDNKISLEFGKNCWNASDGDKLSVAHDNPCRAVAECYLLMKDAEKNNGANNT